MTPLQPELHNRKTEIRLDARDLEWRAEMFHPAMEMVFKHKTPSLLALDPETGKPWCGPRIRIQALTFNGRRVFDHRLLAKPYMVTAQVRTPDPKIWGGGAA